MSEHENSGDHYDHGEQLQRNMPAWKQREIAKHDHEKNNFNKEKIARCFDDLYPDYAATIRAMDEETQDE